MKCINNIMGLMSLYNFQLNLHCRPKSLWEICTFSSLAVYHQPIQIVATSCLTGVPDINVPLVAYIVIQNILS